MSIPCMTCHSSAPSHLRKPEIARNELSIFESVVSVPSELTPVEIGERQDRTVMHGFHTLDCNTDLYDFRLEGLP